VASLKGNGGKTNQNNIENRAGMTKNEGMDEQN